MLKNVEGTKSNNNVTKAMLIGSVVGVSIGLAALFSCINNVNNIDAIKKTNKNMVVIRREINEVNNTAYVSTAIIAASVSLGLGGLLRIA
ncbi:MAG: hypothetical protein M1385_02935 [Candidatus Marsarchaeota archaeon]|nr:hypothetical protein [Candidatus Marsarchaeota archaeon]